MLVITYIYTLSISGYEYLLSLSITVHLVIILAEEASESALLWITPHPCIIKHQLREHDDTSMQSSTSYMGVYKIVWQNCIA